MRCSKGEWDKHIIRSYMTNRNGSATKLYNILINDGTISCVRGTYNNMRSQINKDVQNNVH